MVSGFLVDLIAYSSVHMYKYRVQTSSEEFRTVQKRSEQFIKVQSFRFDAQVNG